VSRTLVVLFHPLIVPVCPDEVNVLPTSKAPVISLRTKCALYDNSGGLVLLYLNPEFLIFVA